MNFDEQLALSIQPSRNHCQTLSATIARANTHMAGHAGLGSIWLGMLGWDGWLGCLARWTLAIHDLLKNFMV